MSVDDAPWKSVGMIRADRWAYWVPHMLVVVVWVAVGWQAAVVFVPWPSS